MLPNGGLPQFPAGGALASGKPLIQYSHTPAGPVASALNVGIIDFLQVPTHMCTVTNLCVCHDSLILSILSALYVCIIDFLQVP